MEHWQPKTEFFAAIVNRANSKELHFRYGKVFLTHLGNCFGWFDLIFITQGFSTNFTEICRSKQQEVFW